MKSKSAKKLGLYIHIPFCQKKCDYCNFISFCKPDKKKIEYVDALLKEIALQCVQYSHYIVDTIFIVSRAITSSSSVGIRATFTLESGAEMMVSEEAFSLASASILTPI